MDTLRHTGKAISAKVSEGGSATSKETNKQIAKDSNVSMTTRARAAANAVGDKLDQKTHAVSTTQHSRVWRSWEGEMSY